ncbi:MAG: SMC-Scp complex subunit ScpB [Neisseriaceae bacterium]|nr:SMC-Scp complex subunit ScpB [Neisseriaceae bacterium]
MNDFTFQKTVIETAFLTTTESLNIKALQMLFSEPLPKALLLEIIASLQQNWKNKGLELVELQQGWRFKVRPTFMPYLANLSPERQKKYSKAVMETLAIIAYKQPVTRGDIESIRGVSVASNTLQTLLERGWITAIGQKEVPGRPTLFATTAQFLEDLTLKSLSELPSLNELAS